MSTVSAKAHEIERKWFLVDATDIVAGRLSSEIAKILRGKHKPLYTPHVDCGDNVIVINAEKVCLKGKKLTNKIYYRHTGYPGGIKDVTPAKLLADGKGENIIKSAVARMISRNKLGRKQLAKLHVYKGETHPHEAQKPEILDIAGQNEKNVKFRETQN
jgi:large subunit ribosomal protein L13